MEELTRLIREDMKPALGVTEPGAIAFATARAKVETTGEVRSVDVALNSGMYKNAYTCGIPQSSRSSPGRGGGRSDERTGITGRYYLG